MLDNFIDTLGLVWTPEQDKQLRELEVNRLSNLGEVRRFLDRDIDRPDDEIIARGEYLARVSAAQAAQAAQAAASRPPQADSAPGRPWTQEHRQRLRNFVQDHPGTIPDHPVTWEGVENLFSGRTKRSYMKQWYKMLARNSSRFDRYWGDQEIATFFQLGRAAPWDRVQRGTLVSQPYQAGVYANLWASEPDQA